MISFRLNLLLLSFIIFLILPIPSSCLTRLFPFFVLFLSKKKKKRRERKLKRKIKEWYLGPQSQGTAHNLIVTSDLHTVFLKIADNGTQSEVFLLFISLLQFTFHSYYYFIIIH